MEGGRIALAVSRFGVLAIASLVSVAGVTGCAEMDPAGPDVDPDITTTTQAIGEMKCASIAFTPVNREASGGVVPAFVVSGRTYGSKECTDAVVIDVINYAPAYLGSGGTFADWADPVPTSEKACSTAGIRMDLYEEVGPRALTYTFRDARVSFGSWDGTRCTIPRIGYTSPDLNAGGSYRFVAQAAVYDKQSAPFLKKVRVESLP